MKTLVDSNILVYAFDTTEKNKHIISKNIISEIIKRDKGIVSIQNLAEFSRALTEKAKNTLNHNIVRTAVLYFKEVFDVLDYDAHTIADALNVASSYKIHFFDALIITTMEENYITQIVTENEKDFKKIPWLEVTNPFKY